MTMLAEAAVEATALGTVMQTILYLACSLSAIGLCVAAFWALVFKMKQASRDTQVNPDAQFVTRGEMTSAMATLRLEIARDHGRIEKELQALIAQERTQSKDVACQIKELTDYTHTTAHKQNEIQHAFNLRVHQMLSIVTQLAHKSGIPTGPEPKISPHHEA